MNDTTFIEPLADDDFSELLLRHMLHDPEVLRRAQNLKISADDMILDEIFGNDIYKEVMNIILSVGHSPISADQLFNGIKRRFDDGNLDNALKENTLELLQYFYDEHRPLERAEFFDTRLGAFIKKRRARKLINEFKDDPTTLASELNRLNFDVSSNSEGGRPRVVSPFAQIIYKTKSRLIGTGLTTLDGKIHGLSLGDYAMLIGYSGGGKSATGMNMVGKLAEGGCPSTYISCEEHEDDMAQRAYSRVFRIPYAQLRDGNANIELEAQFNGEMYAQKRDMLAAHMRMIGLKGVDDELTANYLYEVMLRQYETTGFMPKFVMLDQLQFITPDTSMRKASAGWEIERTVAAELDQLSHRKIDGKNFVLWVQHQAKGKVKSTFSRDEIDGFKGIIHKADLVIGVGRESENSPIINLFSLKTRHCKDFRLSLVTQFEYMEVTDVEAKDTLAGETTPTTNPNEGSMTTINHSAIPRCPVSA